MICRSFKHFSQKHADNFVPLPNQPENNDIPVQTPPTGFDALRTLTVCRIYRELICFHNLPHPGPLPKEREQPLSIF